LGQIKGIGGKEEFGQGKNLLLIPLKGLGQLKGVVKPENFN